MSQDYPIVTVYFEITKRGDGADAWGYKVYEVVSFGEIAVIAVSSQFYDDPKDARIAAMKVCGEHAARSR